MPLSFSPSKALMAWFKHLFGSFLRPEPSERQKKLAQLQELQRKGVPGLERSIATLQG